MGERRALDRLPVRFRTLVRASGAEHEATLLDVSPRGARIACAGLAPAPASRLELTILQRHASAIPMACRVVWSRGDDFAVEFDALSEEARRWIDSVLGEEGTGRLAR
jgi:hypothetical protein